MVNLKENGGTDQGHKKVVGKQSNISDCILSKKWDLGETVDITTKPICSCKKC